jgi:hypothetical protein
VKTEKIERMLGLPSLLLGLANGVEIGSSCQQEVLKQLTRRNALYTPSKSISTTSSLTDVVQKCGAPTLERPKGPG